MLCPTCNSAIKIIPAGISKKTGKPYNSFQACSNRECSYVVGATYQQPVAPQNAPQAVKQPSNEPNSPDWDLIALGKVKHGVACAFIQAGKVFSPVDMQPWVDWIMDKKAEPEPPLPPDTNIPF